MSIRTVLSLSREALLDEGEPDEVMAKKRKAYAERVRPERLKAARRNSRWTEIESDFVGRLGGRWLVSASSDRIYQPVRGTVFLPHSVNVVADRAELAFYVDADGDLVFLEQLPGTWTEHLEKKAARQHRRLDQEAARKARYDELRRSQ